MTIGDLYEKKNYPSILDNYLTTVVESKYKRDAPEIQSRIDELVKTLYSCFFCGAYTEVLELLDIIAEIDFVNWKEHQADFLHFEFEALLFFLFNKEEYSGNTDAIEDKIEDIIPKMETAYAKIGIELKEDVTNLIKLFRDYQTGIYPYYELDFLYPYAPPFGEGKLNLEGCGPYISLTIKEVTRGQDAFTAFSFKIEGYTHEKLFWPGPSWRKKERFPIVKKALPLLNLVLLRSTCANPGIFIPLYHVEQVSDAHTSVYAHDGTPVHVTIFETRFDAQWSGNNIPNRSFSEQEFNALSEDIKAHYNCNHYFIQFYQAKNNMNAGLYVESFLLFCTCAESMLYNECNRIAARVGKELEYILFSTTKQSRCVQCKHFMKAQELAGKEIEVPDNGTVPSVFSDLDFLRHNCGVSKDDIKKLKELISVARDEQLRNSIIHGRTNEVSLETLKKTEAAIVEMQKVFNGIQNKIQNKQ